MLDFDFFALNTGRLHTAFFPALHRALTDCGSHALTELHVCHWLCSNAHLEGIALLTSLQSLTVDLDLFNMAHVSLAPVAALTALTHLHLGNRFCTCPGLPDTLRTLRGLQSASFSDFPGADVLAALQPSVHTVIVQCVPYDSLDSLLDALCSMHASRQLPELQRIQVNHLEEFWCNELIASCTAACARLDFCIGCVQG